MRIIELENKEMLNCWSPEYRLITREGSTFRIREMEEGIEISSEGMEFTCTVKNNAVRRQMVNRHIDVLVIS